MPCKRYWKQTGLRIVVTEHVTNCGLSEDISGYTNSFEFQFLTAKDWILDGDVALGNQDDDWVVELNVIIH